MSSENKFIHKRFAENRSIQEATSLFNQRIKDALEIYLKYNKTFVERNCPICGASEYDNVEKFHKTYDVAKCKRCGSLFVNPAPSLEALKDYYNNSECNKLLDQIYRKRSKNASSFITDDRVAKVMDFLKQVKDRKKIKILEIGCGSGSFLSKLRRTVSDQLGSILIEYCGIDIDKNAIENNEDQDITLIHSSVEEFVKANSDSYDYIMHFELIEHLIDPYGFMQDVRRLLKDDGTVIFTTQNSNGLEMIASGYNSFRLLAHSIFPPMHLNAFSIINLSHFAIRSNFSILEIQTPGKLDVDMVSITKEFLNDEVFLALAEIDDDCKGLIQSLISKLKVSSHMQCVLRKI